MSSFPIPTRPVDFARDVLHVRFRVVATPYQLILCSCKMHIPFKTQVFESTCTWEGRLAALLSSTVALETLEIECSMQSFIF